MLTIILVRIIYLNLYNFLYIVPYIPSLTLRYSEGLTARELIAILWKLQKQLTQK
jgi:hypothetical protein